MTRLTTKSITLLALCITTACSSSSSGDDTPTVPLEPTQTVSMQLNPTSNSDFSALIDEQLAGYGDIISQEQRNRSLGADQNSATVAARVGFAETTDGLVYFAFAGLHENDFLSGSIVDTGTVTYDASYKLLEYTDIASNPTEATEVTNGISVVADFTDNMISADDGMLAFEGTLSDTSQKFDGTVTWRDADGEIEGVITNTAVLGAFQGSDENTVFAGFLNGTPEPQ